jgi:MraZ protein
MPSTEPKAPIYNDCYEHLVDSKRRVQIPAKWRPAEEGSELTLILWPKASQGPCLRVLPPAQMEKLLREIDGIPNDDPRKVTLKRFIGSKSAQVTLDTAGRICLPEARAREAGITEKAILVGLLDRFEIWSPERYGAVATADEVMATEAFKMME